MTNSSTWSAPSSAATAAIDSISDALRDRIVSGEVVSSTEMRKSVPSTVYSLESIRSSSASEKRDTSDFAANISAA